MKKVLLIAAFLMTSSYAFAGHVIECTDDSGEVIKAHMESNGDPSMADIEITGVHYQGLNNNSSGVISNVPVQVFSWGVKFDFADNYSNPQFHFQYSVNAPLAELTQDISDAQPGAVNYSRVDLSDWQKLSAGCISYTE